MPLQEWPTGLVPEHDGWFVVNVRDVGWAEHPEQGHITLFENPRGKPTPERGIRVRVLQPGQMLGLYREENAQEGTRSSAHPDRANGISAVRTAGSRGTDMSGVYRLTP
jgi:hypothetical protein